MGAEFMHSEKSLATHPLCEDDAAFQNQSILKQRKDE